MTRAPMTIAALLAITACQGAASSGGEVLVSAAASLTDAFTAVEAAFETDHPEFDVVLNFGGSSTLREQIIEGAPVDVFASANITNMDQVEEAGAALEPQVFAANRLQIAVPVGNPGGISSLADFANPELYIGLCVEQAPCGELARRALELAGVSASPDTNEPDVRALLTKIESGELDGGIVFVTDVLAAAGTVEGIDLPEQFNVPARYPIAVLTEAPHPDGAARFVEYVLSARGRSILESFGFLPP